LERDWNRTGATIWMQNNWTVSIWASVSYMILIFAGQKLMSYRDAFDLRWPLATWNALLSLFSIVGFLRSTPEFFRVLSRHGFHHSVCVPSYSQDSVCGLWMEAFILSKMFELVDTAFIVLRKRPLIFLHWYHHVTVLVYCWHAMKDHTAAGRWFSWMNFAVHSIMYAYYAASALRIRAPRWVSMGITTMQLSQMIVGCYLVYYVYYVKTYQPERMCHQTWENLYFCFGIYFTYFLLFLNFFYKAYLESALRRSKKAAAKRAAEAIEREVDKKEAIDNAISDNNHAAVNGKLKNGIRLRNGYHLGDKHENGSSVQVDDSIIAEKKRD